MQLLRVARGGEGDPQVIPILRGAGVERPGEDEFPILTRSELYRLVEQLVLYVRVDPGPVSRRRGER